MRALATRAWLHLPDSFLIPRKLFALWSALISIAALGGVYIVVASSLIPFNGYQVVRYIAVPSEGCAGTTITLNVERVLPRPLLGRLDSYTLVTNWIATESGTMTADEFFSGVYEGPQNYGHDTVPSPALRSAPDREGHWRLNSMFTLKGRVLGWPRSAVTNFTSPDIFVSLPESDPRCKQP